MTLNSITKSHNERNTASNKQFIEDFKQIVKSLKPDAKEFSFDGNSESNDEGGSYMSFSSFYIDDIELEDLVSENPELTAKVFDYGEPTKEDFIDTEELYDSIRDNFYDLPEFVYNNTWKMND